MNKLLLALVLTFTLVSCGSKKRIASSSRANTPVIESSSYREKPAPVADPFLPALNWKRVPFLSLPP